MDPDSSSSSSSSSEEECNCASKQRKKPVQQLEPTDRLLRTETPAVRAIDALAAGGVLTAAAPTAGAAAAPQLPGLPAVTLLRTEGGNNIVARPLEPERTRVAVCQGKACSKRGAAALLEAATGQAAAHGGSVTVAPCKCLDR